MRALELEKLSDLATAFNQAAKNKVKDEIYAVMKDDPYVERIKKRKGARKASVPSWSVEEDIGRDALFTSLGHRKKLFQNKGGICNKLSHKKFKKIHSLETKAALEMIRAGGFDEKIQKTAIQEADLYVSALQDAFDDEAIIALIPEAAKKPEVAAAFEKLGAKKLAKLCR